MNGLNDLKIKIYADGADLQSFIKLNSKNFIKGFTTNPSLMKKNGIKNYKSFAKELLNKIKDKPISFEVFEDDLLGMERQANEIASWGKNLYVKIPITNTKGESTHKLVHKLTRNGISCNVTAIFTIKQVELITDAIENTTPAILSLFAGRIADTGIDPLPLMKESIKYTTDKKNIEILWASTREAYNYIQARQLNCNIITMPPKVINQISGFGKSFNAMTIETVRGFLKDSRKSKFKI